MKKILSSLAIIMCSTVVTTPSSMQTATKSHPTSIAISKKSSQKLQDIENDYKKLRIAILNKYTYEKAENSYQKPSDVINDILQDKSINTKYMTLDLVFTPEDTKFLNQQFKGISRQYSTIYAWSSTRLLMYKILEDTCYNLQKREIIRSAARVALRLNPVFTEKCKLSKLFDECDNTVVYNLEHWKTEEDRNNMLEAIKGYKNILAKNKLDARL